MSTGPVVREELRSAIQAELREMLRDVSQATIAAKIGLKQATVSKAQRYGELGQEFATKFLRAYRLDEETLVAKHGTRITAWDVVALMKNYPAIAKTIEGDTGRWPASRLVALAAKVKRSPPRAAPDGRLIVGSWRDMLDHAEDVEETKAVGGVAEFREQAAKLRRTP